MHSNGKFICVLLIFMDRCYLNLVAGARNKKFVRTKKASRALDHV